MAEPDTPRRPSASDAVGGFAAYAHAGDGSPGAQAIASVAEATRVLIQELMGTEAPVDDLHRAAALVGEAADLLSGVVSRRHYEGFAESSMAGNERTFLQFSPLAGPANPLAPPLVLSVDGDIVLGEVVFGDAYEGPPGCVHGGFVAAAFDELLGYTMSFTGRMAMTGTLSVRYRRPTPLHRPLQFRGRIDRVSGRKISTSATLYAGDTLTAEADALFIAVEDDVFSDLMRTRGAPAD
jgi:acyl-coenzyme A thioesterase PaaI-like protein